MTKLYSRVFVQILDSSIAEDFMARHVFEDMLKVCENGIVDMTRTALARRFNIPIEDLNRCIEMLESPDAQSRDVEFEGRRIEKIDQHRDWGWVILNWAKYEEIKNKADVAIRVARHRESQPTEEFVIPTMDQLKERCRILEMPEDQAAKFFDYYKSNGWKVGKNKMRSWTSAMANWSRNYFERRATKNVDHNQMYEGIKAKVI